MIDNIKFNVSQLLRKATNSMFNRYKKFKIILKTT